MKRVRILVAAIMAAAACLVAVPASSTAAVPLTITCTRTPASCTASGELGPLIGVTIVRPGEVDAAICFDPACTASAVLLIRPGLLFAGAVLGPLQTQLRLTAHFIAGYVAAPGSYGVEFLAGGGVIEGVFVVVGPPRQLQCVVLDHLTLRGAPC